MIAVETSGGEGNTYIEVPFCEVLVFNPFNPIIVYGLHVGGAYKTYTGLDPFLAL